MKKEVKRAFAVILSIVLLSAMFPLSISAYTQEELTASTEGTVISNETFTDTLRVYGAFGEGAMPKLIFKNCSFENIEIVAGGDWDLVFKGTTTITGKITVVNETETDMRDTNDFVFIDNPPTGTTIEAPDVWMGLYSEIEDAEYTINNVVIEKDGAGKPLNLSIQYFEMSEKKISYLSISNATAIRYNNGSEIGGIEVRLEEENVELELNVSAESIYNTIYINANPVIRCSCEEGNETCACECCQTADCCGQDCIWECDTTACSCRVDYDPGEAVITGTVDDINLMLAGIANIEELSGNAEINIETWNSTTQMTIGTRSVNIMGDGGSADIFAKSGANISVENIGRHNINVNIDEATGFSVNSPHIFGNGSVFIGAANDDAVNYSISCTGEPLNFSKEIIAEEGKTHLNVTNPPAEATEYDFSAECSGVTVSGKIYHKSILLATPDCNSYNDMNFTEDVKIICSGEESDFYRVEFYNCTFDGNVTVYSIGKRIEVSFDGENTIAGEFNAVGEEQNRFAGDEVFVWNLPSGTAIGADNVRLSVCGDNDTDEVNIGGVTVEIGDNLGTNYNLHLEYYCRDEHQGEVFDHSHCNADRQGRALNISGNVVSFDLSDDTDVREIGVGNVFTDINGTVTMTEGSGELFLRMNELRNDNPDDMNEYKGDAALILDGEITDYSVELIGKIDISALAYNADYNEHRINIGTWESFTDVNIGSHKVCVCGGAEFPVSLTAANGAFIEIENSATQVNVNNGRINMGTPHIYGSEDNYGVYIGTAANYIEYKLICEGNEPGFETEYFAEEGKTHLSPLEMFNNIGDWYLEATADGIVVLMRLAHKEWMCNNHEFDDWIITKAASCYEAGEAYRECSLCQLRETSLIFPSHKFTAKTATDEFIASPAGCTAAAVYYTSCAVCGCSSKGTDYEATFVSGSATGHSPATPVKENSVNPTCEAEGSFDSVVYCTVCEAEINRVTLTVAKTAHKPATPVKEDEVAATFDNAGSFVSVVYCEDCHAVINKMTVTVPALRHTKSDVPVRLNVVNATCVTPGSYDEVYYCRFCNIEMSREAKPISCTDHTPAPAVEENRVEATCKTPGSYDRVVYCSVCKAEITRVKNIPIPKSYTHSFGAWTQTLAPTVNATGVESRICSVCDKTETRVIEKLKGISITETQQIVSAENGKAYVAAGLTVSELLDKAGADVVLIDAQGKLVDSKALPATGMRLVIMQDKSIIAEKTLIVSGDIDCDGLITSADSRLALRAAVKLDVPNEIERLAALINGAKEISSFEARLILRAAVGLEKPVDWLKNVK